MDKIILLIHIYIYICMDFEIINSKDLDNFNNDYNIKYLKEKE